MEAMKKVAGVATWVKDLLKQKCTDLIEFVKDLVRKIKEWISSWFDTSPITERVADSITNTIMNSLKGVFEKLKGRFVKLNRPLKVFVIILGLAAVAGLGLLSWVLFSKTVQMICEHQGWQCPKFFTSGKQMFTAEQVAEETAEFVATGMGCTGGALKKVKECCDFVISVARSMQYAKWIGGVLLMLIPVALRRAFYHAFGTKEQRLMEDYPDWETKSLGMIRIQKVPMVLVSKEYFDNIKILIIQGKEFISGIKNRETKSMVVSLYSQLVKIEQNLERYRAGNNVRIEPYCIHISGKPGIGKSLFVKPLIEQVTGMHQREMYNRPMGEFWSGFVDSGAVIYDEFLVGNDDLYNGRIAREFLMLVSSGPFQPEMASVDDPSTGIKGTTAAPKMVVTMNNTRYNNPLSVDKVAFQRRRKYVIHVQAKRNTHWKGGDPNAGVDLAQYTEDERARYSWLNFIVLPGNDVPNLNTQHHPALTYTQICDLLRDEYERHVDLSTKIVENLMEEGQNEDVKTPREYMEDAIREIAGVKTEDGILQSLIGYLPFTGTYVATGGDKKWKNRSKKDPGEIMRRNRIQKRRRLRSQERKREEDLSVESATSDDVIVEEEVELQEDESFEEQRIKAMEEARLKFMQFTSLKGAKEEKAVEVKPKNVVDEKVEKATEVFDEDVFVDCDSIDSSEGESTGGPKYINIKPKYSFTAEELNTLTNYVMEAEQVDDNQVAFEPGETIVLVPNIPKAPKYVGRIAKTLDKAILQKEYENDLIIGDYAPDLPNHELYNWAVDQDHRVLQVALADPDMFRVKRSVSGATLLMIGAGLAATIYVVRKWLMKDETIEDEAVATSDDVRMTKTAYNQGTGPRTYRRTKSRFKDRSFQKRSGFMAMAATNQVKLYYKDGSLENGFAINKNWIAVHGHQGPPEVVKVTRGTDTYCVDSEKIDWYEFDEEDLCLFRVPVDMQVKDVRHRFLKEEELLKIRNLTMFASVDRHPDGNLHRTETVEITSPGKICRPSPYTKQDGTKIQLERAITFYGKIVKGDCGTMAYVNGGTYAGKHLGLIVAGTKGARLQAGVITIITKDMIEQVIEHCESQAEFVATSYQELPDAPVEERVYEMTGSKLEPSAIAVELMENGFTNVKEPSIKSEKDLRGPGIHPVEVFKKNLKKWVEHKEKFEVDQAVVDEIYEEMELDHEHDLAHPIGHRKLTFDEALKGIPGLLNKLNLDSSVGFPHIFSRTLPGKRDFVWFDGDELKYTPEFKEKVYQLIEDIESGKEKKPFYWLGYLKDELVSQKKLSEARTRMIFCNCIVHLVVFRMEFGFLLVDYNNSAGHSTHAMGINQYSHDMDMLVNWLSEVGPPNRIIAGDYKGFDMHHMEQFRQRAYKMDVNMAKRRGVSDRMCAYFIEHEANQPIQVGNRDRVLANFHFSGNFLTTIMNEQVREGYERYVFREHNPLLTFKEHIRVVGQGDDHVINSSPECKFDGHLLKKTVEEHLGQEYTSADKSIPEVPKFQDISETKFLGAHFREVNGRWTGAMLKETLEGSICWTRNQDDTLVDECRQMIEYASQWDKDYFDWYTTRVNEALRHAGFQTVNFAAHKSLQRQVALRTTQDDSFYAMGNGVKDGETSQNQAEKRDKEFCLYPEITVLDPTTGKEVKLSEFEKMPKNEEQEKINRFKCVTSQFVREMNPDQDSDECVTDEEEEREETFQQQMKRFGKDFEERIRKVNREFEEKERKRNEGWIDFAKRKYVEVRNAVFHDYAKAQLEAERRMKAEELEREKQRMKEIEDEIGQMDFEMQKQEQALLIETMKTPDFIPDVKFYKKEEKELIDLTLKSVLKWLAKYFVYTVGYGAVYLACDTTCRTILWFCITFLSQFCGPTVMYYWFVVGFWPFHLIANIWIRVRFVPVIGSFLGNLMHSWMWNLVGAHGVQIFTTVYLWFVTGGNTMAMRSGMEAGYDLSFVWHAESPWYLKLLKIYNNVYGFPGRIVALLQTYALRILDQWVGQYRRMKWLKEQNEGPFEGPEEEVIARKIERIEIDEPVSMKDGGRMQVASGFKERGFKVTRTKKQHYKSHTFEDMERILHYFRNNPECDRTAERLENDGILNPGWNPDDIKHETAEDGDDEAETTDDGYEEQMIESEWLKDVDLSYLDENEMDEVIEGQATSSEASTSGEVQRGLTSFQVELMRDSNSALKQDRGCFAISEEAVGMDFGTDSYIFRDQIDWDKNQTSGVLLQCIEIPFGVLGKGTSDNLQNMPFERFVYWHGDVDLTFQLNGSPFQQGLVACILLPLTECTGANKVNVDFKLQNALAYDHVLLSPNRNTTGTVHIPYRYFRSVMNTYAQKCEATVVVMVVSPLKHGTSGADTCSITWYSKFPNAKFSIPRPLSSSGFLPLGINARGNLAEFEDCDDEEEVQETEVETSDDESYESASESEKLSEASGFSLMNDALKDIEAEATGATISKVSYDHINGDITNEVDQTNTAQAQNSGGGGEGLMDKPALVSASMPMYGQWVGMSKCVGMDCTYGLQLKPNAMYTAGTGFDLSHTKISWMCNQPYFFEEFEWSKTDVSGTKLASYKLNSEFGDEPKHKLGSLSEIWNAFVFWRADIQITVLAPRTSFHSGRLRATITFGAPAENSKYQTVSYNHILNFTEEIDKQSFVIPYNAQTEYLCTFAGPGVANSIQDYSLGYLTFYVANQLRCPDSVYQSVNLCAFVSLLEPRFAVPKPMPYYFLSKPSNYTSTQFDITIETATKKRREARRERKEKLKAVACAGEEGGGEPEEQPEAAQMDEKVKPVQVTEKECPVRKEKPSIKEKFPYEVYNILDLCKRYHVLANNAIQLRTFKSQSQYGSTNETTKQVMQIRFYPYLPFSHMFAAWSGSLKYRVFLNNNDMPSNSPVFVSFYPVNAIDNHLIGDGRFYAPAHWHNQGEVKFNKKTSPKWDIEMDWCPVSMNPIEVLYSNTENSFIDFTVPFQTHYNYCLTRTTTEKAGSYQPYSPGQILIQAQVEGSADLSKCTVFIAAGDDFRYGMWRPTVHKDPVFKDTRTSKTRVNVGGYVMGDQ